jgi:hypothetical protein
MVDLRDFSPEDIPPDMENVMDLTGSRGDESAMMEFIA